MKEHSCTFCYYLDIFAYREHTIATNMTLATFKTGSSDMLTRFTVACCLGVSAIFFFSGHFPRLERFVDDGVDDLEEEEGEDDVELGLE